MSDELGDLRATCRANARKISFLEAENWRLREQIADFTIELERRGDALVAASERIQNLEAALAAVPVEALRRYFDHSQISPIGKYEYGQAWNDIASINTWLPEAQL